MKQIKAFFKEEDGVGVVEIILILVVLIALVAIFKDRIMDLADSILDSIENKAGRI